MSEAGDSAVVVYQAQLREIFRSCDSGNKGFLSRLELEGLCRRLQLQDHRQRLYTELGVGGPAADTKVYLEQFQTALVSVLSDRSPHTPEPGEEQGQASLTDPKALKDQQKQQDDAAAAAASTAANTDLHLNLPPDMTEDDPQFVNVSEDTPPHRRCKMSPPSPLKRALIEDTEDESHAGKQRRAGPGRVETFEAEGQLVTSPGPGDPTATDWDAGLTQLRQVCGQLDVGHHGYLTLPELGQVCHHIGMDHMEEQELRELFHKLDRDQDDFISFDEFVHSLSHHLTTTSTPPGFHSPPPLWPHSGRKVRTLVPPAQQDKQSPALYTSVGTISLFSSLQSADSEFARAEDIVDYWEKLSVPHGADLLSLLGFDPDSSIQLKELSLALSSEFLGASADSHPLRHAITATYNQELTFLRSGLDQTSEERNKLRSDLADALSQNVAMAAEVDERHAQLQKSFTTCLQEQRQDHLEQVRRLQGEVEREREAHSSQAALLRQTSEHVQELELRVTTLTDQLARSERETSSTRREAAQAKEKQRDLESHCDRLHRELQQTQTQPDSPGSGSWETEQQTLMAKVQRISAENKELRDHNDELVAQLDELQHRSSSSRRGSIGSQGRSASTSRIPVRARASSLSSGDRTPSLSVELRQHQRQSRSHRRGHEEQSSEGEATPINTKNQQDSSKERTTSQRFEKEKKRMWEQFQREVSQKLAEQRRELQAACQREKEELQQEFQSRQSLRLIEHREQLEALENRLKQAEKQQREAAGGGSREGGEVNMYTKSRVRELEGAVQHWKQHYEGELQDLRTKYDQDLARLKASREHRVDIAMEKLFEQGASALKGKLKEDFDHLVQKHRHDNNMSSDSPRMEKEEMYAAFERDKLMLIQQYESQILGLQEEVNSLQRHFEAERAAFQQMQSGELAQSIRQELQEEAGGRGGQLQQSWEEERRELRVQNQLLEEELADVKGALVTERQRAAETVSLRDTVQRLRCDNKEAQSVAESLKERMARLHHQHNLVRANFERRIDHLERDKEKALRVQALQLAGNMPHKSGREEQEARRKVLEEVLHQVESLRPHSPPDPTPQHQSSLDQLQGQITQLQHQLQEARTAQLEFQQLKEECELLKQTNGHLEEMVRVLRQRSDKEVLEREREDQEQVRDLWEEKKKLQNMLQRATDKLLKTSAGMAAGQTQLVREVEQLKQRAASMVELETFTGLQVSLLETQRLSISLQEALTQRTQLADRIMTGTEKEQRHERESLEEQKREVQSQLEASTDMYRHLAQQHRALRQSSSRLADQLKELYVENADLITLLQQSEAKQLAAQRRNHTLQQQCQAWHDAVHRLLQQKQGEDPR
ncbi:uncharacterized protein LOC143280938 isoform X2 [Babylonia areolata]|uniref:uncharacterized protein LOC143280938 isoform X2 n=1 Tax=Babylonia areolata TaxID=304850 RepID=UPI003FD367B6